MTDIVERLRDQGKDAFAKHYSLGMFKLCADAADEIERLRNVAQSADTRIDDHMVRARRLVEDHIEAYGMVPHPDRLKEAIAEQSQKSFDLGFCAAGGSTAALAAPRMTFDEWFLKFSSWGLSHQQLLTCAFTPGSDPGDAVYTSPSESVMTRHICSHWINFYGAAQAGWNAALTSAERACVCQEQHRRGYCTEPGCPHAQQQRNEA